MKSVSVRCFHPLHKHFSYAFSLLSHRMWWLTLCALSAIEQRAIGPDFFQSNSSIFGVLWIERFHRFHQCVWTSKCFKSESNEFVSHFIRVFTRVWTVKCVFILLNAHTFTIVFASNSVVRRWLMVRST